MINNVPSAPFSMTGLPPVNQENAQLADAMKRLSATKYGFGRAVVEKEIFARLEPPKPQAPPMGAPRPAGSGGSPFAQQPAPRPAGGGGASFLDEWLAKRQKLNTAGSTPAVGAAPISGSQTTPRPVATAQPFTQPSVAPQPALSPQPAPLPTAPAAPQANPVAPTITQQSPVATAIPQPQVPSLSPVEQTVPDQAPATDPGEVSVRLR